MRKLLLSALVSLTALSAAAFQVDGIDYAVNSRENKTVYVTWSSGTYAGEMVIPSTVTYNDTVWTVDGIGDFAFMQATKVTKVTLPSTVDWLGTGAFGYCTGLTGIELPAGVRWVGQAAFNGCSNLAQVNLPEEVDFLGGAVLAYTAVTKARIPRGVTEIPQQFFEGCGKLTSVEIPEGFKTIGFQAFQNTFALTGIKLPSTLETIGNNCFTYSGLTSLHFPAAFRAYGDNAITGLTALTAYTVDSESQYFTAVDGVLYSKDMKTINSFPLACGLTTYEVNAATDSIADFAFYGAQLTALTLPADLRVIGKSACATMSKITSMTVPSKVQYLGKYAFFSCTALTDLVLGASIDTIGTSAFNYDDALRNVTSHNPVPPRGAIFPDAVYNSATLHVPDASLDAYKQADGWKEFKTTLHVAAVGPDHDATLTISGTNVSIDCLPGTSMAIYTLAGMPVFTAIGSTSVDLAPAAYIVRVGGTTRKIMTR